jgi:ABC-type multidrug transport system fused ATPase/permease subunit
MVFDGNMTIGMLTFVIAAYQRFNGDDSEVLYKISSVLGNKKIFSTFYKVLNWKNSIVSGNTKLDNIHTGLSIEFRNVWFKYPKTRKWILKDISFKVEKDEDIAIVGKNGAGKSTMIKLLLRIYDPQKGDIFVDGMNIKELDIDSYYRLIGILSQSFNQLSITVEDNIYIGDITKKMDDGIKKAAKSADIHDTIMDLPNKYDTFLSREVKDGIQLSGGQWQKLAIARAFFRNAKLLILDEPTSGVDSISEEKIFENIRRNAENRTTIIVSHRFATVRKAGRILVIDEGNVVEDGDHATLLQQNGLYAQMYNKQVG